MKLWVIGEYIGSTKTGIIWECVGVFDSQEEAEGECKTRNYFVGPLFLNDPLHDSVEWPGCYYPLSDKEKI